MARQSAARAIVGWEGFSFAFLWSVAFGILQLDMFLPAKILFGFSSLALFLKLSSVVNEYMFSRRVIGLASGLGLTGIYIIGMLYLVSVREAKIINQPPHALVEWLVLTAKSMAFLPWGWMLGVVIIVLILVYIFTPSQAIEVVNKSRSENRDEWLEEIKRTHDLIPLQPNIVQPIQGNTVEAHEAEDGVIVEGRLDTARNFRVLAAAYENNPETRPRRRIIGIDGVGAEIIYRFFSGAESIKVRHAAWLSEPDNKVNFNIKASRDLITATIENERLYAIRREFDGAHPQGISRWVELPNDLSELRIRLFSGDGVCLDTCEMMLVAEREPEFKVTLVGAAVWKLIHLGNAWQIGADILDRLYKISSETHEKVMAPGGFDPEVKAAIDAEEKEKETGIAGLATVWEKRTASFIGLHLSEKQRNAFLERQPSIQNGLDRIKKSPLYFVQVGGKKPSSSERRYWNLIDAVTVRWNLLYDFIKAIK